MSDISYISLNKLMNRLHEEAPNSNFIREFSIPRVKAAIYEALRKIGSPTFNVLSTIEVEITDSRFSIPENINFVRSIKINDKISSKVDSFEDVRYLNTNAYMINGKFGHVNVSTGTAKIEVIKFPEDELGNPLILNSEAVISAVISYFMTKVSRKLWINNKLEEKVYREYEREWLFNVNAAKTSSLMPSFDEINEWHAFSSIMPLSRLHLTNTDTAVLKVLD